ncbi:hypothetical protein ABMA27_006418 [Loxostege sticticalis]|uniref:Small heat shock protein n=1 Tax=Loxostege sticticalis TaxID=481309 RepID=A0ABR3IJ33_LOXSC
MIKPFAHNTTRVEIGPESSSIHVPLLDYEEDSIEVKLKHRVLSITATPYNGTKYEELVIVPSIFDSRNVAWVYDGIELIIYFDKIEDYEVDTSPSCVKNISTAVRIVPKLEDFYNFEESVVL